MAIKQGGFWDAIGDSGRFLKDFLVDQPSELFGIGQEQQKKPEDYLQLAINKYESNNEINPMTEGARGPEKRIDYDQLLELLEGQGLVREDAVKHIPLLANRLGDMFKGSSTNWMNTSEHDMGVLKGALQNTDRTKPGYSGALFGFRK